MVDYDRNPITFPPVILATNLRPDITLWSLQAKKVILIELTCPAEEGILAAHTRKVGRYLQLCADIERRGWAVISMPVEVGARGFTARSVSVCLRRLGLSNSQVSALCKRLGSIAARASYAIYLGRNSKDWNPSRALIEAFGKDAAQSEVTAGVDSPMAV